MPDRAAGSDKSRRVLLVIDEDPKTGRLVRLSLHGPACQVMAATRYVEGLRLAARQRPDLVLMETRFHGATGFEVAEQLQTAPETRGCAFAFLTAEDSVVLRFSAVQAGAMEVILKPVEARKLNAAVEAVFARLQREGPSTPVSGPAVATILSTLEQVEQEAASGTLSLRRAGQTARIVFAAGRVQAAELGASRGDAAVTAIARYGDWEVEFHQGPAQAAAVGARRAPRRGPRLDDSEPDLRDTHPRLAAMDQEVVEAPAPRPTAAPPRTKAPPPSVGLAPEQALGTGEIQDTEDRTVVDPTHPLQKQLDLATRPAEVVIRPEKLRELEEQTIPTVSDIKPDLRALDLATTEEFLEDVPTPLSFAADVGSAPVRPPASVADLTPVEPPAPGPMAVREWLAQVACAPLLLIVSNHQARSALANAAEQAGFAVLCVENGREGYNSAGRVRPVAILGDLKMPDMEGRELVAAIRTDFVVRETPVLLISGEELAAKMRSTGGAAVEAVLRGLGTALAPRVQLFERLRSGIPGEVAGRMEPIGITTLLRTLGAAKLSGRLEVRKGELRSAEVTFSRGEISAVTVNVPHSAVGPLALLHLLAYEWQEFCFDPVEQFDEHLVPLGDLSHLVQTASQQNNVLAARIFKQGMRIDDVQIERNALDLYLQTLAPDSLEVLIRLVEGEPSATLVAQGVASPGLLRSMVYDLRRQGVIRVSSLRPVRLEGLTGEVQPVRPPAPARRRWLVVVAAGFATVLLAAGGYLVYWHFLGR